MVMDEDDPSQQPSSEPEHERRDAAARAGDLDAMARANEAATFGDTDEARTIVPGVLSGDLGPKGRVSAQLRDLSRTERSQYGEVPPGAVSPGGGAYLLLPMIIIALVLIALAALVIWAVAR